MTREMKDLVLEIDEALGRVPDAWVASELTFERIRRGHDDRLLVMQELIGRLMIRALSTEYTEEEQGRRVTMVVDFARRCAAVRDSDCYNWHLSAISALVNVPDQHQKQAESDAKMHARWARYYGEPDFAKRLRKAAEALDDK